MHKIDLDIFAPISLSEMNEVSLMKRKDTKFVVNQKALPKILSAIAAEYRILQVGDDKLMTYNSLYFDTPEAYFYHMHHNGLSHRVKIRIRNYVESNLCFLEIKQKDSQGNTNKKRIKVQALSSDLDERSTDFITHTTAADYTLTTALENKFNRFTLVNLALQERVTVDLNLAYDGQVLHKDLAIIELKQPKLNRLSPIFKTLKAHGIHPYSISKYCMGMATLNKDIKQNLFKPKFLKIKKITT